MYAKGFISFRSVEGKGGSHPPKGRETRGFPEELFTQELISQRFRRLVLRSRGDMFVYADLELHYCHLDAVKLCC